ncbi:type IV pilus biogenesis protein PilO [Legionella feeleii]|uniref:Type IV pilus biogenesis protein PilO n=2 Tax=Legionella feeleii TaxID=453 RepID=A0A378ITV9_9GAMM|nr:type IV pilus biogenesis protein PilO [Legionella feeleii]
MFTLPKINKLIVNNFTTGRIKPSIGEVNRWWIMVLAVLLIIFDYVFFINQGFQQYSQQRSQEVSLKREFERRQHKAAILQVRRKNLKELNKRYKGLLTQFSTSKGLSILLEELSRAASANGLVFDLFAPLPEVAINFYIELPIKMTIRGRYEQLTFFLKQLAQWDKIVTIDKFELLPVFDAKQKVKREILVMKLIAKIYRPL